MKIIKEYVDKIIYFIKELLSDRELISSKRFNTIYTTIVLVTVLAMSFWKMTLTNTLPEWMGWVLVAVIGIYVTGTTASYIINKKDKEQ